MAKTSEKWIVGAIAAALITIGTLITVSFEAGSTIDVAFMSEAEAEEDHEELVQTQAGFNSYTLKAILHQELEILQLKINAEEDAADKEIMEEELSIKKAFVLRLEEEEKLHLIKGEM